MTVIRPNSVSGITSITAQANEINFFRSNGTLAGLQLNGVNFNTTTGVSTFNNLDVGGVLTYQDVTNVDSVGIITARSTIDAQGDVSIADKIIHTGDTNTAIRFPAVDTISLETAGTERLRITSGGDTELRNIVSGINNSYSQYLKFRTTQTNGQSAVTGQIAAQGKSGWGGNLVFSTKPANGTPNDTLTERIRIASNGLIYVNGDGTGGRIDATAGDGSMTFSDGNGRQTFKIKTMASGQSAAHVFDASGRLGIANTNPTTELDVKGNIRMRMVNGNSGVNSDNIALYIGNVR